MRKLRNSMINKKNLKKLAEVKGFMSEDKIDYDKFKENIQPSKHKHWKNKKQMKAFKKLRTAFLKSKECEK